MESRIVALAKSFKQARDRKSLVETELELVEGEIEQIGSELKAALEAEGVNKISVEGVGTVFVEAREYARVNKENMDAFVSWLDANGEGALAKRTVQHQTLTAWYKEQSENDKPLPPTDICVVTRETKAKLRAA
jgi:septation ring formation regulator EzrA